MAEVPGSILSGVTFYCLLFSRCKPCDANIAIFVYSGYFVENSIG